MHKTTKKVREDVFVVVSRIPVFFHAKAALLLCFLTYDEPSSSYTYTGLPGVTG